MGGFENTHRADYGKDMLQSMIHKKNIPFVLYIFILFSSWHWWWYLLNFYCCMIHKRSIPFVRYTFIPFCSSWHYWWYIVDVYPCIYSLLFFILLKSIVVVVIVVVGSSSIGVDHSCCSKAVAKPKLALGGKNWIIYKELSDFVCVYEYN